MSVCAGLLDECGRPHQSIELGFASCRARETVQQAGEFCEHVFFLCSGWAARYVMLPDGSRQIVDFVLPGEIFPASAPFRRYANSSVKAVTGVNFAMISRFEMERFVMQMPSMMQRLAAHCLEETDRVEGLVADLGRRTATERVARLIMLLLRRLDTRGLVQEASFDFPLRQQHIADAVGLTQVHVNRILRKLRHGRLISILNGRLRIHDLDAVRRLADVAV